MVYDWRKSNESDICSIRNNIGLLLLPVHEVLHGVCYKKGQKVYIGICLKKFAAFAVCHEPISKRRFVIMSLMPMLLGIIPLAIFLLSPPNAFSFGNMYSNGDYWYAFSNAGLHGCPHYLQTST